MRLKAPSSGRYCCAVCAAHSQSHLETWAALSPLYADDLQVLSHFSLSQESLRDAVSRLEACVAGIKHWITQNHLKINDRKTEFLPIVLRSTRHQLLGLSLAGGDASVAAVSTARNLGANPTTHIEVTVNNSNIVKSCYFQLQHIARISRYLPRKTKEWVVNALVTSRLDYCNSLMHGTTQHNLDKLYRACRTRQQDLLPERPSLIT